MTGIDDRIAELGLVLPPPPLAAARYATARLVGRDIHLSGHGPMSNGRMEFAGVVGADITAETGRRAARRTMLNVLSTLRHAAGSLDAIEIYRMQVFVQACAGFTGHSAVADGASDIVYDVFGPERGAHARSAIGVLSLPFNIPVEIEVSARITQP